LRAAIGSVSSMGVTSRCDVLILGGGPAGCAAALTLAAAGRKVVVLEKEVFPRFHIGESLLPYNRRLLETLGLLPLMESAGFLRKVGAQFWLGNGSRHVDFRFSDGGFNEETSAWQVERSDFDHRLLQEVRRRGVEVHEGRGVAEYEVAEDGVTVRTTDDAVMKGAFLIDATGQSSFTGVREGLREMHPRHRKIALFGHFRGIPLPPGDRQGDIIIVRLEQEWAWLIPLSPEKVSVGLVLDQRAFKEAGLAPEAMFDRLVGASSVLSEKLAVAERIGPLRAVADYSYTNRRFVSRRLVRVGDAAGFMDPVFSSGVHLAMESGHEAAKVVDDALRRGAAMTWRMRKYERWLRRSMGLYFRMIEKFYTRPFIEVFVEPKPVLQLPAAVSAVLAGRLDNAWPVRWRLAVFFLIVALRARLPLTSPVRFT
jgi:flavin-dependent dehydrogenase